MQSLSSPHPQPLSCHPRAGGDPDLKMTDKSYYVYILAKERNSTFYVGVTSDLIKRIGEHKDNINCDFTTQYNVKRLVYFEGHTDIEEQNPDWEDLYEGLF